MTICDLRKSIMVTLYGSFWNDRDFATIGYSINARPQEQLYIQPDVLKNELVAIGSIEEDITDDEFKKYHISQWDALNLVIRHEYAKYMEADIMDSDIGKSIDNLIK